MQHTSTREYISEVINNVYKNQFFRILRTFSDHFCKLVLQSRIQRMYEMQNPNIIGCQFSFWFRSPYDWEVTAKKRPITEK